MSIAIDAMGGDYAPREIVLGCLAAAERISTPLILVGDPDLIRPHLPAQVPSSITILAAKQVIEMHEKPVEALRQKRESSIVIAANLIKEGKASAMVSAGNTGAAAAASLLAWRQIPGVHRPAIASMFPNPYGGFLLLDAGASPDVDPEHLVEFGQMGKLYMKRVMGRAEPKVHLLNIGEEEGKGNAFAKQAHQELAKHPWFAGNIEGKDLFKQPVDVVVCDAFVGNIVLKTAEGVGEFLFQMIRDRFPTDPISKLRLFPARKIIGRLRELRKEVDYAEYGGSPLLGLNGLCIICHGRSNARAIENAILVAKKSIDADLVNAIRESFVHPKQ